MKRRNFIKSTGIASTALMTPNFLKAFQGGTFYKTRSSKILVIIQLSGGNDGLNTIVPYENDLYYNFRPTLGIKKSEVIKVSDQLGLNPNLKGLRALYDQGSLSIINNVGYPNPDRSHFRSMDIWHTGSPSDAYWTTGWLGRYLDSSCSGCSKPYHALELDDTVSLALKGTQQTGFAMSNPNQLRKTTNNPYLKALADRYQSDPSHSQVDYLYKTMINTQSSAKYLYDQSKTYQSKETFPNTAFGRDLKQIAELITADTDTRIYYASLTGFDTHANQRNQQARLLEQYDTAISAFVKDLKKNQLFEDTLIMTFSEFGRRVKQNASNGTDHGTANNLFLMSGALKKKGFFNDGPDLNNLIQNDLQFKVDFRRIYATLLNNWLETDHSSILNTKYPLLSFI